MRQQNPSKYIDLGTWKPRWLNFEPGRKTPVAAWYTPGISKDFFVNYTCLGLHMPGITQGACPTPTENPGIVETKLNGRYERLMREGYCKHEGSDIRSISSGPSGAEVQQLVGGDFHVVVLPRGQTWAPVGHAALPCPVGHVALPRLPGWDSDGEVALISGANTTWNVPQAVAGQKYIGLRGTRGPAGISQQVRKHVVGGHYCLHFTFAPRDQDDRQPKIVVTIGGERNEELGFATRGQFQPMVVPYQASSEDVEVKIENVGTGTVFIKAIRIQSDEDYFRLFFRGRFIRDIAWQLLMSMVTGMDLYNNVTFVRQWDWENASFFFAAMLSILLQLTASWGLARAEMERFKDEVCTYVPSCNFGGPGPEQLNCCAQFKAWFTMRWDSVAMKWAHTLCFFLAVPHVLKDIVIWLHPNQQCMGKSAAKVKGARAFACTWPSRLHFLCDNEFGSHILLPWKCLSKLLVFIMQLLLWGGREEARGSAQLGLKAVLVVWSAYRLRRVMVNRKRLQTNMLQELRECQIPGVAVDPGGRKGIHLHPSQWLNIMAVEQQGLRKCDLETRERVDAIYNGIFRKHFCWEASPSKEEKGKFRVENYVGWRGGWKSLWGTSWLDMLTRVALTVLLLLVFYQHLQHHPFRWEASPAMSPATMVSSGLLV